MAHNKTILSDAPAPIGLASFICLLGAFFYLYEFILQVSPGVMTHQLMRDLRLNASSLGIMSSCYYYAYTLMQMPAGFLYDKLGARRVLFAAIFICSAGALVFGHSHSMAAASVGRMLMGAGSAFAFVGALVLVARWFAPKLFAVLTGGVQLLSSIGAMVGGAPLATAVLAYGWRQTISTIGYAGFALALLVGLFVRSYPKGEQALQANTHSQHHFRQNLVEVCTSAQSWLTAFYGFCSWAPVVVFAALWGTPFIVAKYGISTPKASLAVSMVWLGIGLASPLAGLISDRVGRRTSVLQILSLIGAVSTCVLLYLPSLPLGAGYLCLILFGIAAGGQALSFALVKDNNHPSVVGTAVGLNNMAVVVGGALFQPLVGYVLHALWNGEIQHGVHVYQLHDYQIGLAVLPICYITGFLVSRFFLVETYCIQKHK